RARETRSRELRGARELSEDTHQVGQPVVRVEAARVRQHPDARRAETLLLLAELRRGTLERVPVGLDAEHGDERGAPPRGLARETPRAGAQLVGTKLRRRRGRALDEVGDADAALDQL